MKTWTALMLILAIAGLGGAAGILSQGTEISISGTVTGIAGCHKFFVTADNGTTYAVKVMGWWEDPNGSTISSCYLVTNYVDLGESVTVTGYLHGWGHDGRHGHGNMIVATIMVLEEGTFQRRGGGQTSITGTIGEVNVCCRYFTLQTANGTYYVKVTDWWENESGEIMYCVEVLQALQPGEQVTIIGYSHGGGSWVIATEIETQSDTYTRIYGYHSHEYTNETTTVTGTIQFLGCRVIRLEADGETYMVVLKGLWMAENGTTYTPCQLTSMMSTGEQLEVTGYQVGNAIMAVSMMYQGITYVQVTSH